MMDGYEAACRCRGEGRKADYVPTHACLDKPRRAFWDCGRRGFYWESGALVAAGFLLSNYWFPVPKPPAEKETVSLAALSKRVERIEEVLVSVNCFAGDMLAEGAEEEE